VRGEVSDEELAALVKQAVNLGLRDVFLEEPGVAIDEAGRIMRFTELSAPSRSGVYYVLASNRVKIGKSRNIASRVKNLKTGSPRPVFLVAYEIGDPTSLETAAHERWKAYRRHREWFACEGELATWLLKARR
jgi:hypothetical protein